MNEIVTIGGVSCYEKDGVAWLNLEAVARGLGFTQTQNKGGTEYTSIRWETVNRYLSDLGFPNKLGKEDYIPENIFYRLAMKAKNETAEKFQALVADEIIPSIRKHGAYMTPETLQAAILNPDTMIQLCQQLKAEQDKNKVLQIQNSRLTVDNQIMQPKALFADSVAASGSTVLVGELAKILRQNGVDMGEKRLFNWMRENGYLIKRKGTDYNMPTQKSIEMGLFKIKETVISHSDGHTSVNKTPKITGKGQQYFINLFLSIKGE